MKLCLYLLLFLPFIVTAQSTTGNPHYDFAEHIVRKNGNGKVHLNRDMTDLSIAGYYHESRIYEDSLYGPPSPVYLTLRNKKIQDAREFILNEASKYRILLINEAHHKPQHRLFTKSLLQGLHGKGYNVFMAEGIKLKNGLESRSYPVNTDGTLLNEPAYASLIRYANKTGYTIHAYEYDAEKKGNLYWDDSIKLDQHGSVKYISYQPRDSMTLIFDEKGLKNTIMTSVRESAQAENIVKVMKMHPGSKFIIHVGHGHLYEDGPMMGAKLRALLKGEDVLTINQEFLTDRVPVIDTASHDTIRRDFDFVLQDINTNLFFNNSIPVDYMVFNSQVHDSLGRPAFLLKDVEKRTVYNLPGKMLKDCPCLFSAYYQDEYEKEGPQTIAVDVVFIKDVRRSAPLLLYQGKYIVIKKNKEGLYADLKLTIK
ncbi:MAG TPA: hypothetical protein VF008_23530 [Niastella sp.]